jgi:transposase
VPARALSGLRRAGDRRAPAEVARSAFGPRLQAAVVTLSVRNRISRRDVVECCEQLFAARISTGSVEAIMQRAGDALERPCRRVGSLVRL